MRRAHDEAEIDQIINYSDWRKVWFFIIFGVVDN